MVRDNIIKNINALKKIGKTLIKWNQIKLNRSKCHLLNIAVLSSMKRGNLCKKALCKKLLGIHFDYKLNL